MVENDIGQAQETIFIASDFQNLFNLLLACLVAEIGSKEARIVLELAADGIRAVALASFLQGGVVQHGIAAFFCLCKVLLPLAEGAHPFGHDGKDSETIERKIDNVIFESSTIRENMKRVIQNGGSSLYLEHGVDVEVAGTPLYSLTVVRLVLDPVHERTGMGDGQVEVDGLGELLRKSGGMVVNGEKQEGAEKEADFRSANLSRAKAPPSRGKLVLKRPFLAAGVPA